MKVSLKPGEQVLPFSSFEPVIQQQVFGHIKKPQDPKIADLMTWNPQEKGKSLQKSDKPRWLSESRDNYRGFFFTDDYQRFLRLKYEESADEFHPESLKVESRNDVGPIQVEAKPSEGVATEESRVPTEPADTALSSAESKRVRPATAKSTLKQQKLQTTVKKPKPVTQSQAKITKSPKFQPILASTQEQKRPASSSPPRNVDPSRKARQDARIKKLNETTRWLPDSAFTTYYGKPAFCNYGRGNTDPTYGGLMYGSYMTSHNIAPHEGENNPKYQQVYEAAELKAAKRKPKAPEPPRKCKDEDRLNPEQIEELKSRQPILAAQRKFPSKDIIKPNLYETSRFKSEHNTPNTSNVQEPKVREEKAESVQHTDRVADKSLSHTLPRAVASTPVESPPLSQTAKQVLRKEPSQPPRGVSISENTPSHAQEDRKLGQIEQESRPTEEFEEARIEDPSIIGHILTEEHKGREGHQVISSKRFNSTSYQDMTGHLKHSEPLVYEPFRYCKNCQTHLLPERPELTVEDMLRPPRHLGELPVKELDPKTYRDVPPKWTQRIPAAGLLSYRGPSAYSVIFSDQELA